MNLKEFYFKEGNKVTVSREVLNDYDKYNVSYNGKTWTFDIGEDVNGLEEILNKTDLAEDEKLALQLSIEKTSLLREMFPDIKMIKEMIKETKENESRKERVRSRVTVVEEKVYEEIKDLREEKKERLEQMKEEAEEKYNEIRKEMKEDEMIKEEHECSFGNIIITKNIKREISPVDYAEEISVLKEHEIYIRDPEKGPLLQRITDVSDTYAYYYFDIKTETKTTINIEFKADIPDHIINDIKKYLKIK